MGEQRSNQLCVHDDRRELRGDSEHHEFQVELAEQRDRAPRATDLGEHEKVDDESEREHLSAAQAGDARERTVLLLRLQLGGSSSPLWTTKNWRKASSCGSTPASPFLATAPSGAYWTMYAFRTSSVVLRAV
jgi:hypothetical protein